MSVKKIFIASPSDCIYERNCTAMVIDELRIPARKLFGIDPQCVSWDSMPPIFNRDDSSAWQSQINKELVTCDIFIGFLNKKYGTPIPSMGGTSGTHYEFMQAINSDMLVLTYHRKYPRSTKVSKELKNLKSILVDKEVPHMTHSSKEEFLKMIRKDILIALGKSLFPIQKKANLEKFFILPPNSGHNMVDFKIVYPPIHALMSNTEVRRCNWQQRLLSDVIYEDFKAIEKVKDALILVGAGKVDDITCDAPDLRDAEENIVWLCIPRNVPAQRNLEDLRDRARFRFKGKLATTRYIEWKNRKGEIIKIRSPLAKYLKLQRPGSEILWNSDYADVYARDFAVISRFKRGKNSAKQPIYHYFMAGIRGLGTWGAGKVLSGFYELLPDLLDKNVDPRGGLDDDFQAILQISYNNRKIHKVRDVSNETQDYFDNEMKITQIKKRIKDHHHSII